MTWRRVAPAGAGSALATMLAAATLIARQPAPAAGQISGSVKSSGTNAAIARARVIAAAGTAEPHVTLTSADGTFVLRDLPPAAYTITVTRTGYAPYVHGQGRRSASAPIVVRAGQPATLDILLEPGRSLPGRLLDEDGTPLAGANVEALTPRLEGGRDTLVSAASARTDDRGEFRLHGLGPGEYIVSGSDPAFENVSTAAGVLHYSPTYYPGVSAATDARPVVIGATGTVPSIEFRLRIVPPVRVSGRVAAMNGRELLSAAIVMTPIDDHASRSPLPANPSIGPDGRFSFGEVPPGRYQVRARGQTESGGASMFALFSVVVDGQDVDGITMTLHPGAVIEGTVAAETQRGTPASVLPSLRVRAPSIDGSSFGDALTGVVQADGSFALRGVIQGAHQIVVDGLPAPWRLRQVLYRGADVTDRVIDIATNEQVRGVRVVITDAASVVDGVVHDRTNRPAANAGVLVFPRLPLLRVPTSRRMRAVYTDPQGRFSISGLPAGEYVAVASMAIDETDLARRDRLRALEPLGTGLQLDTDVARATLTLTLAR